MSTNTLPNILTVPNPILRQKSAEVEKFDQDLKKLVTDLTDLLKLQIDPIGLGLSAPQIGVLKRIFVVRAPVRIKPFVNPKITRYSKKRTRYIEGCLSIPLFFGHILRPADIDIEAYDPTGKKFIATYKGLVSRAIQHELDHLNGILFIDHVHAQKGKLYKLVKNKKDEEVFKEVVLV